MPFLLQKFKKIRVGIATLVFFLIVPVIQGGAQQSYISQNEFNMVSAIGVNADFIEAGRVDVDWEINFVEVPQEITKQALLRIKGRASSEAVVISCNFIAGYTHGGLKPCAQDRAQVSYSSDYTQTAHDSLSQGTEVYFERINLEDAQAFGSNSVAIDFTYL
ncbi:MAG: hypothetical protein ACK4VI_08310 [Alphaproteobacteria bacterium]